MTGESATCVGNPFPPMEQPPIRREDDCDAPKYTSSWHNIFAVAPAAGEPPPELGVNFIRATQQTINTEYTLTTVHGNSRKSSRGEKSAMLTLGQDLRKLGLGAVVWDCVSERSHDEQTPFFLNPLDSIRRCLLAKTNTYVSP